MATVSGPAHAPRPTSSMPATTRSPESQWPRSTSMLGARPLIDGRIRVGDTGRAYPTRRSVHVRIVREVGEEGNVAVLTPQDPRPDSDRVRAKGIVFVEVHDKPTCFG